MVKNTKKPAPTARKTQQKVEPTPEQRITKLYKRLKAQIDATFYANAFKTCEKILRISPSEEVAQTVKGQLRIELGQYNEALAETKERPIEQAYCLYKLSRFDDASAALENDSNSERSYKLLDAQLQFRQHNYEKAIELYEDLLSTVSDDSPELQDLEQNIQTLEKHKEFMDSIPSYITSAPPIENLESAPIAQLVNNFPLYKSHLKSTLKKSSAGIQSDLPERKGKIAEKYAGQPPPDPERWLPKRERPSMAAEILRKKEIERGKKKAAGAKNLLTQGTMDAPKAQKSGGGNNSGKNKKKGKR